MARRESTRERMESDRAMLESAPKCDLVLLQLQCIIWQHAMNEGRREGGKEGRSEEMKEGGKEGRMESGNEGPGSPVLPPPHLAPA